MILHVLIAMVVGWIQDHQQRVITYLREENRVLRAQLGGRRLCLTETERRRLPLVFPRQPAAVGMPEIMPVLDRTLSPFGSAPAVTAQV